MKTLWCKNEENPSDRISHAWAPLRRRMYRAFEIRGMQSVERALEEGD